MIPLERIRTAAAITSALRGKRRIRRNRQLIEGSLSRSLAFKSSVWKNAKPQLKEETKGKCAYCESKTWTVAHGDVEHFRPKSIYWWLAYCYDNYLYSCQICNQSHKSNHFHTDGERLAPDPTLLDPPLAGFTDDQLDVLAANLSPDPLHDDQGQPRDAFNTACLTEQPRFIDPYTQDPQPFFKWSADDTLREVTLEPASADPTEIRCAVYTRDFLGLNRPELLYERYHTYEILKTFAGVLTSSLVPAAHAAIAERIQSMMAADAPYAGMVRYFVTVEWQLDLT